MAPSVSVRHAPDVGGATRSNPDILAPMSNDDTGKPTEASPFAAQVVALSIEAELDVRRRAGEGWSIEKFCDIAGITKRTLERWKNGHDVNKPLWGSLSKIGEAFDWDDRTLLQRLREAEVRAGQRAQAVPTRPPHASSGEALVEDGLPAFVIGRAVDRDQDFVGRKDSTQRVLRSIQQRQAVQLVGPARMGKTSLLLWLRRHAPPGRPVVWIDAADRSSPATLVQAIATALDRRDVVSAWGASVPSHEAADALKRLPAFVLLLDDAHKLARDGRGFDQDFFDVVRTLVETEGQMAWVSASDHNLYDLFVQRGLTSKFLNGARVEDIGLLDEDAADALAYRGKPEDGDRLREVAGRFALGLQWLGERVSEGAPVDAACDAFATDVGQHVFSRWWKELRDEERRALRRCDPPLSMTALDSETRRTLRHLCRRGLAVELDGAFSLDGEAWGGFVGRGG
jgi:transcriptional regulator with XRE-family HTH domain